MVTARDRAYADRLARQRQARARPAPKAPPRANGASLIGVAVVAPIVTLGVFATLGALFERRG